MVKIRNFVKYLNKLELELRLEKELLIRYTQNPILNFKDVPYNCNAIYNPGAVKFGEKYLLLPRVEDGRRDNKLHVALSDDGINYELSPEHIPMIPTNDGLPERHMYDPRITYLEGSYYITYCSQDNSSLVRIGLLKTEDFQVFDRIGFITPPWNRNCALFPEKINGQYVKIERPMYGNEFFNMISFSPDLINWGNHKLIKLETQTWFGEKWGAGPPPIKTKDGWLQIIHGVFLACNYVYRIGVILLDLEEPWKVVGQCPEFILTPREDYERTGETINCVFCNGVIPEPDGTIKIYYGAADTSIGLAFGRIDDLINACKYDMMNNK